MYESGEKGANEGRGEDEGIADSFKLTDCDELFSSVSEGVGRELYFGGMRVFEGGENDKASSVRFL
jgi:hypothetical protein